MFYDTVHTFLDSTIRRVIERAERDNSLKPFDVKILKLLYLVRYVDDINATLDNLVILMADRITLDKISAREFVGASLERLLKQNYIGRTGDIYNFLTDEEQDIQREIYRNTTVDTASIVKRIGDIIFGDIYTTKKYKYSDRYDFPVDTVVDNTVIGSLVGGMKLKILTVATDAVEKSDMRLTVDSTGQALIVLADTPYYQLLENAMKVRNYLKQRNVSQLPQSTQNIIRTHQDEARKNEEVAKIALIQAVENAEFYVDGEHLQIKSGTAQTKIEQALKYLVTHIYSELNLIRKNADSEADISAILKGTGQTNLFADENKDAIAKVDEFLEMQQNKNLRTSMFDIQSRYKTVPYGWKEIDIACIVAQLIHDQKVTVKVAGNTIQPDNPSLPSKLHRKSEVNNTNISKRQAISLQKIREVKEFLRDYFESMNIPNDEDNLIKYIVEKFGEELSRYENLQANYSGNKYPDKFLVDSAVNAIKNLLANQKDNFALIDYIIKNQDGICDLKEKVQSVEEFFKNQKKIFDEATNYVKKLSDDRDYIEKDTDAFDALKQIRLITQIPNSGNFNYSRLPELNNLISAVHLKHDKMLADKRQELFKVIDDCLAEIRAEVTDDKRTQAILQDAENFFAYKKDYIKNKDVITLLDGQFQMLWSRKDDALFKIKNLPQPKTTPAVAEKISPVPTKKIVKSVYRMNVFPQSTITTEAEIDSYVEEVRGRIKNLLKQCDELKLN